MEQSLPVFDNQVPNLEENGRRALQNASCTIRLSPRHLWFEVMDHDLTIFELRQARPDLRGDADWRLSGYGHCQDFVDHVAVVFGAVAF